MLHYIYRTTNLVNGKTYIGAHSGAANDDYLGSGVVLRAAIRKYGRLSFQKTIVSIHNTAEEMFAEEARLITPVFVAKTDNYNVTEGGHGGFSHCEHTKFKVGHKMNIGNQYAVGHTFTPSLGTRQKMSESAKSHTGSRNNFYGKIHTPESRQKMSDAAKNRHKGAL